MPDMDMRRMQEEAARRAREMQSRARHPRQARRLRPRLREAPPLASSPLCQPACWMNCSRTRSGPCCWRCCSCWAGRMATTSSCSPCSFC